MALKVELINAENANAIISVTGHVVAANAQELDAGIKAARAQHPKGNLVLDFEPLEYISSAGLRVVMQLLRSDPSVSVINASNEVYDVFEITGLTELLNISRAAHEMSIEGCEVIGHGGFATVYRTDPETIVKVYNPNCTRDFVDGEREMARKAFVMGVPTAIPYDLVKVGDSYGLVFELLECKTLAELLDEDASRLPELAKRAMDLLKELHAINVPKGTLTDRADELTRWWSDDLGPYLTDEENALISHYLETIPRGNSFLHGDYHFKNIVEVDGQLMLIDIGDAASGNGVFDVAQMGLAYVSLPKAIQAGRMPESVLGFDVNLAAPLWIQLIKEYYGVDDATAGRLAGAVMPITQLLSSYIGAQRGGNSPEYLQGTSVRLARMAAIPVIQKCPEYAL